jgi:hypothetical protein
LDPGDSSTSSELGLAALVSAAGVISFDVSAAVSAVPVVSVSVYGVAVDEVVVVPPEPPHAATTKIKAREKTPLATRAATFTW